jgi:hypothetical protein
VPTFQAVAAALGLTHFAQVGHIPEITDATERTHQLGVSACALVSKPLPLDEEAAFILA